MKNKIIYFGIAFLATINIYAQTYFKEGYFVDNQNKKVECLIKYQRWSETPVSFDYKLKEDSPLQTKNVEEVNEFKIYKTAKYYKRYKLDVNVFDKELNLIKKKGDLIFLKVLFEAEKSLLAYEDIQNIFFYEHNNELLLLKYAEKKSLSAKHREFQKQLYENLFCEGFTIKKYSRIKYEIGDLVNFFNEYATCKNQASENFYEKRTKVKLNFKATIGATYTPETTQSLALIFGNRERFQREDAFNDIITYSIGVDAEFTYTNEIDRWRLFISPNIQYFRAGNVSDINPSNFDLLYPQFYDPGLESLILEMPIGVRRYFDVNENTELFISAAYAYNFFIDGKSSFSAPYTNYGKENISKSSFLIGLGSNFGDKYSFSLNYYLIKQSDIDNLISIDAGNSINFVFGYQLF